MIKTYTFYKISNYIDDRVYIGTTSKTLDKRWQDHQSCIRTKPRTPFHKEAAEIGLENFYIELIEIGQHDRRSAVLREEELIERYNSREEGFNGSWSRSKENNGWFGKGASNDNFTNPDKNPSKGVIQKTSKPVEIEGTEYPSVSHAARGLDLDRTLVSYRIKSNSEKFKNWRYL